MASVATSVVDKVWAIANRFISVDGAHAYDLLAVPITVPRFTRLW
jgi:hypothetical protein